MEKQNDDICKQYCNEHKIIYFLCTYPIQISWGLTLLVASILIMLGKILDLTLVESILSTSIVLIFLFVADGMGGTRELPWKVNIVENVYKILANTETKSITLKVKMRLLMSILYKAYANSIILAVILFISSMLIIFLSK